LILLMPVGGLMKRYVDWWRKRLILIWVNKPKGGMKEP